MGVKGLMLKATVLSKTLPCSFWQGNWRPFDNHSLVRALLAKKIQRVIIIWLSLIPFDVFLCCEQLFWFLWILVNNTVYVLFILCSFSEANVFFWSATIAVSLTPFVLLGYYVNTWDVSAIQSHCKDIISRHLYKEI